MLNNKAYSATTSASVEPVTFLHFQEEQETSKLSKYSTSTARSTCYCTVTEAGILLLLILQTAKKSKGKRRKS